MSFYPVAILIVHTNKATLVLSVYDFCLLLHFVRHLPRQTSIFMNSLCNRRLSMFNDCWHLLVWPSDAMAPRGVTSRSWLTCRLVVNTLPVAVSLPRTSPSVGHPSNPQWPTRLGSHRPFYWLLLTHKKSVWNSACAMFCGVSECIDGPRPGGF